MKNLSGGSVGLAMRCQWWLTEEAEWEPVVQTQAMIDGQAVHKMIELDLLGGRPDVHEATFGRHAMDKYNAWVEWAKTRRRIGWLPEVALAYHTKTGNARHLATGDGWHRFRDVDRTCEVPIVCDVITMSADVDGDLIEVYDWKTGRRNEKDGDQILACAVGAAAFYGVERARGYAVYLGKDVTVESWEYDAFDLAGMANRLARVFDNHVSSEPMPGAHCKSMYCRAQTSCMRHMIERGE